MVADAHPIAMRVMGLLLILISSLPIVHASSHSLPAVAIHPETVRLPVEHAKGLRFHRLSTADGLSQSRVAQIIQDDLGFMWFGTQYGLNRYDGYNFKLFVHEPGNERSAAGSFVYSLFKDRDGFLWIGWSQGLDRLDPRTDTFTHYFVEHTIVHISQDRNGMLWLATGSGLRAFDPSNNTSIHYRHDGDPRSLPANEVNWSGEDSHGRFWVGTSRGLAEFDRASGTVVRLIPRRESVQIRLFEDHRGQFWITQATGNGLSLFDPVTNTVTPYSFYATDPGANALTGIMGIAEDADGNLWLGSPGMGLLRLNRERNRFHRYGHQPFDVHSIAEDNVIALLQDRDGNLWTGLHSAGVNHFGQGAQRFEVFRNIPGDPNSLSLNFVNAIVEDRNGVLWIGNDDGLNRIDRQSGRRELIDLGLGHKPMVISLAQDEDGAIWVGTFAHGLTRYDPYTRKFATFVHDPEDPSSLSHNQVHRVHVDRKGTVWVATDNGLDRFDPVTGSFQGYKLNGDNRFSQSYLTFAEDSQGHLWLGTAYSGLHRFDPESGKITMYLDKRGDPNGLRDNAVLALALSRRGILWIGTQNGLNSLDIRTGVMRAYDTRNGLPANAVACILEDELGDIWMSTTQGLSKLTPETGTFTNYSLADALAGNDLTGWDACSKSDRGELFFAGFAGAVAFIPQALQESPSTSPLVLTDFEIDGAKPRIGAGQALERAIAYAERVTLSHEQRSFSVTFAGLRYGNSNATRYRYRLAGMEDAWHESPSSIRQATYTTLPAGRYTLQVQMATERGNWQTPGISLSVLVQPPWWASWWFRTLGAVLLVMFVWWVVRARVAYVRREVTLQMEARNNERMRIAGDLHDTLLQGLLSASFQLSVVQDQLAPDVKARPLLDHVSNLLRQLVTEGRNAVRGLRTWNFDSEDLEHAIAAIPGDLRIDSTAQLCFVIEGKPRPLRPTARNEIYLIAREAISNALRHAAADMVEVQLQYFADTFRLAVSDDGRGFIADTDGPSGTSHFGLSVMSERAQRLGAELTISSSIGSGTEVVLSAPACAIYQPETDRKLSSAAYD